MANNGGGVPKFKQSAKSVSALAGGGGKGPKYGPPTPQGTNKYGTNPYSATPPASPVPKPPKPPRQTRTPGSRSPYYPMPKAPPKPPPGHGGMGQKPAVTVKAHTRAAPMTPPKGFQKPKRGAYTPGLASMAPPAGAPAPTKLPPTNDKPTKTPPPGRKVAGATGATGPTVDPYAGLYLYPNQTPDQLAAAALAPQYAQIASQTAAEQASMKDFATAMLAQLQGMPARVGQTYDSAIGQTQGFANAAADKLASLNPNSQDQALLRSIGAPQSQQNQIQGQLQNEFGGGAAALYGMRGLIPSNALEQQKAAAMTYANTLPSIQALAATQAEKNMLYQASQQRAAVAAKYPDLLNSYSQAKATNAMQIAGLRQNDAMAGIKGAQTATQNDFTQQRIDIERYNATLRANGIVAAGNKVNVGVSQGLGYMARADGSLITTKDGKWIPFKKSGAAGTAKVPSATDIGKLVTTWHDGKAQSVTTPITKPDGTPGTQTLTVMGGSIGYMRAYRQLIAMHLTDQQARSYLNAAYTRGDNGRAWLTNREQGVLGKAGLPGRVTVVGTGANRHGVLSAKQRAVLAAAGMLPRGKRTREGFYVIYPGTP